MGWWSNGRRRGLSFLRFCGVVFGVWKESMEPNTKRGRRYDADFKENAVALVKSGRQVVEVARDLGVSTWSLRHWLAQKRDGSRLHEPQTLACETSEQRENRRLRHELDYVRRQRNIIKNLGHCLGGQPEKRFQLVNLKTAVETLAR